ncbi:MAG: hypothetical protein ACI36Y_09575 [Coriobacteriales bacterium]
MDELTSFFTGLGRREKVLAIAAPALAEVYVFALYFLLTFPRCVAEGMLSPEQQHATIVAAPFLFVFCWVTEVIYVAMPLVNLMEERENLEKLTIKGAKSNLNIKLGQLVAFAMVYLVMCLLPVPLILSSIVVFGSLYWFGRVVRGVVHRTCVLELVKERDREM